MATVCLQDPEHQRPVPVKVLRPEVASTLGLLAVVLLTAAFAAPVLAQCPDGSPPPCRAAQPERATAAPPANSLAVLYFDNLSLDTAHAYLADGLTDELIVRLGEVRRLDVKSRFAVRRFRGRLINDPASIGRTLGVAYLVSGSLRPGHDRLRVTVELMRAATGARLWGDVFDRPSEDLLALTEDVARAVARRVAGELLPDERRALIRGSTANPKALTRLVKGNYYLSHRTGPELIRAIQEYQEALRQDSTLAPAYARTALAYELIADWGWPYPGVPPESLDGRISAAITRAFRYDSLSSDAWLAAAFQGPAGSRQRRTALERAITLDLENVEAHHLLGVTLTVSGQLEAAALELGRALEIEPERPITLGWLGLVAISRNAFTEARRWLDSALAVSPAFAGAYTTRAVVSLALGDTARARADARTAVRLGGDGWAEAEAATAVIEAATGEQAAARQRIRRVLGSDLSGHATEAEAKVWFAAALALASDTLAALDVLERPPRSYELPVLAPLPVFDVLRAQPRFQRLLEEFRAAAAPSR